MSVAEAYETSAVSLSELAETANREHGLAQQAGGAMVVHAIAAGEALLAVKAEVTQGEWLAWVDLNFKASQSLAQCYMRLAKHQELARGATSISTALTIVADGRSASDEAAKRKAREMYAKGGVTHAKLADEFGVSKATVTRWLDRQTRQKDRARARRERSARRALARQQQERVARKVGGSLADAYSLVRRTLQALEAAQDEALTPEVRAAITVAMQRLYGVEDKIGEAVRLS